MTADKTLSRSLHDVGLAAWFGGSLMGAVGLNRAAGAVQEPRQRLEVANTGWGAWAPVNLAGIATHLAGGAVLLVANKGRLASQRGVGRATVLKSALTGAMLVINAAMGEQQRPPCRRRAAGPPAASCQLPDHALSCRIGGRS